MICPPSGASGWSKLGAGHKIVGAEGRERARSEERLVNGGRGGVCLLPGDRGGN